MYRLFVQNRRKTSQAVKKRRGKSTPPILLGLIVGKKKGAGQSGREITGHGATVLSSLFQVEVLGREVC